MDAALLCFATFGYWLWVGYAITGRLLSRASAVPALLLAPTVGLAVTEVALFTAVRFDGAANAFALPVVGGLFAAATASLLVARPRVPVRRCVPFLLVLLAAYALNGWPQLRYGFGWLGFASDDMGNYCMLAAGYGDRGVAVSDADWAALAGGYDYTQAIRIQFVHLHSRLGAELSLAAAGTLSGRPPVEVCMPFALAAHLALVWAVGFLAHAHRRGRRVAAGACLFMAVSAPSTFGILDQMLGQIGGLALLCGAVGVLCRPARRLPAAGVARRAVLGGLLVAGLLVHYPEVLPFLAATVGGLAGVGAVRGRFDARAAVVALAAAAGGVAALGPFGLNAVQFVVGQVVIGGSGGGELHVYHKVYDTGHGVLLAWGARSRVDERLAADPAGLWTWVGIAVGGVALAAYLAAAVALSWRRRAVWAALGVMAAATALLFYGRAWFGVHKMVMYAQPFVAVALAAAATARWRAARAPAGAFLAAALAANAAAQLEYTTNSCHEVSRCPLTGASASGLVGELRAAGAVPASRVWVAVENEILARFLAVPVRGKEAVFTAGRLFDTMSGAPAVAVPADERAWSAALYGSTPDWVTDPAPGDYLIAAGPGLSPLNYSRYAAGTEANLLARPLREVHNHLALREAGRSKLHLGAVPAPMHPAAELAFYGPVADRAFPGRRRLLYLGRHLVFQVVNPSPRVRLVLATASGLPEWNGRLPAVTITGAGPAAVVPGGRGSARVVSPPVEPGFNGRARTLQLELDREGWAPVSADRYGVQIERMMALCRDLTAISEDEYAAFRPPAAVERFPDGLAHPHLEYDGVFEEGWASRAARFRLTQPAPGQEVVLRGYIPETSENGPGFRSELVVLIDGAPAATRVLGVGEFEVRAPGGEGRGPRWVECRFSHDQVLPAPDGRRAAALLRSVGFEPALPPPEGVEVPAGLKHPAVAVAGVDVDGWCAGTSAVTCRPGGPGRDAVVRGQVPTVAGNAGYRTEVVLLVDGAEVARRAVGPGDFELRGPAGNSAQARRVECRFTNTQVLPPPDGRTVGACLRFVGFEPARTAP